MGVKELFISVRSKGNSDSQNSKRHSNIKKLAPPGLLVGFWKLDKNQHSSRTCEASVLLQKESHPLPPTKATKALELTYTSGTSQHINIHAGPQAASVPIHKYLSYISMPPHLTPTSYNLGLSSLNFLYSFSPATSPSLEDSTGHGQSACCV